MRLKWHLTRRQSVLRETADDRRRLAAACATVRARRVLALYSNADLHCMSLCDRFREQPKLQEFYFDIGFFAVTRKQGPDADEEAAFLLTSKMIGS